MIWFDFLISIFFSDSGHQDDGSVVARNEEQPQQVRNFYSEAANNYITQWWRFNRAGENKVGNRW